ncbi:expressed unknown protein [Seminavis robusta]|uniref:Uncharacterized protein n=1 Tax=Seminavis robusta TaxID=568900 RepID=A0A9N8I1J0_9STRA|nr:expressed unknown protein [Seminavis robusta]|eukprot:Sro3696_g350440.1 n/a (350) ;mRNA; f:43-1092
MPTHWLWVRFVSSLVALEGGRRGSDDTVTLDIPRQTQCPSTSVYTDFTSFEQGDLETDLLVIRRLDPSVDFLRMRHIPLDVLGEEDSLRWATRTVEILQHVRLRHAQIASRGEQAGTQVVWTRREAVASSLTKLRFLVSMHVKLERTIVENRVGPPAFPVMFLPAVARIVASLFSQEMDLRDDHGRLPLHYAAARKWHDLDWPPEGSPESDARRPARLFRMETLTSLRTAMELSSDTAASIVDTHGRLPLHYMVEAYVKAANRRAWDQPVQAMLDLIKVMVQLFPDALHRSDSATQLVPWLQATATATECAQTTNSFNPEIHLSIPFVLLRENPTLLLSAVGKPQVQNG